MFLERNFKIKAGKTLRLPFSLLAAAVVSWRRVWSLTPLRRPKITLTAIRQRGQTEERVQRFSVQLNFSNEGGKLAKNGAIVRGHLQEPDVHVCVWFFEKPLRRKWIWFSEEGGQRMRKITINKIMRKHWLVWYRNRIFGG